MLTVGNPYMYNEIVLLNHAPATKGCRMAAGSQHASLEDTFQHELVVAEDRTPVQLDHIADFYDPV